MVTHFLYRNGSRPGRKGFMNGMKHTLGNHHPWLHCHHLVGLLPYWTAGHIAQHISDPFSLLHSRNPIMGTLWKGITWGFQSSWRTLWNHQHDMSWGSMFIKHFYRRGWLLTRHAQSFDRAVVVSLIRLLSMVKNWHHGYLKFDATLAGQSGKERNSSESSKTFFLESRCQFSFLIHIR